MARTRKRKLLAEHTDSSTGMASALSRLNGHDIPQFNLIAGADSGGDTWSYGNQCNRDEEQEGPNEEGWQTVIASRPSKRRKIPKQNSSNYPCFTYSRLSKLQSSIKISDLQGLVLYLLADGPSPQWISIRHHFEVKKVVVIMVPGLERGMFDGSIPLAENVKDGQQSNSNGTATTQTMDDRLPTPLSEERLQTPLKALAKVFSHVWPVLTPGDGKYSRMHSPVQAMLMSPLPKSKEEKNTRGVEKPREGRNWKDKPTEITEFVATTEQLQENDYVIHPTQFKITKGSLAEVERSQLFHNQSHGCWVHTGVSIPSNGGPRDDCQPQDDMKDGRDVFAMDCEMCKTSDGELALTRISVVNWEGETIMDELVKPERPIVDYLTAYSGITEAMLEPIQTSLNDVQERLLRLLRPGAILIGHSLNADLAALRLTHPSIIDTSIIYPHPRGPPLKSSLKWLAQKYLNREIQKGHGSSGHDSVEDAKVCLDLVKQKCEKGALWGTSDASSESIFKRLGRSEHPAKLSDGHVTVEGRSAAVVDSGVPETGSFGPSTAYIRCSNDDEVSRGIEAAVLGGGECELIPAEGVDFVWGRLRALECCRGWRNNNRHKFHERDDLTISQEGNNIDGDAPLAFVEPDAEAMAATVAETTDRIWNIYNSLPPCTAFIVYSGSGNIQEMARLQALQRQFRREYQTTNWDRLSVKWTDVEEQKLRLAIRKAREGLGMVVVKLLLRRTCVRALSGGASASILQRQPSTGFNSLLRSSSQQSVVLQRRGLRTTLAFLSDRDAPSSTLADGEAPAASNAFSGTSQQSTGTEQPSGNTEADAWKWRKPTDTFSQSKQRAELAPTKQIYVGNLFFSVTEDALKSELSRFGTIVSCRIIYDRRGLSKGYGFVEFENVESSRQVMAEMDGQLFEGRPMAIQYAMRNMDIANATTRNPPSRTLFIGNLSYEMTDRDLNDLFRGIENVTDVRVAIDRRTGQPRGFAHADFIDVESAQKAYDQLNGKDMYDRKLRLDFSSGPTVTPARDSQNQDLNRQSE